MGLWLAQLAIHIKIRAGRSPDNQVTPLDPSTLPQFWGLGYGECDVIPLGESGPSLDDSIQTIYRTSILTFNLSGY